MSNRHLTSLVKEALREHCRYYHTANQETPTTPGTVSGGLQISDIEELEPLLGSIGESVEQLEEFEEGFEEIIDELFEAVAAAYCCDRTEIAIRRHQRRFRMYMNYQFRELHHVIC